MHQHNTPTQPSALKLLRALIPKRRVGTWEHRRIAELQANRLRRHLDVNEALLDTDFITQLPHIDVRYDINLPTSGMSFWDGHTWVVLLNPTEPETRQRFTLLHELHHIICHTNRTQLFGHGSPVDDPAAERMADYFAACALLPKLYVKRLYGQGVRDPHLLAQRFDVSAAAMSVRLNEIGLSEPVPRCGINERRYRRRPIRQGASQ